MRLFPAQRISYALIQKLILIALLILKGVNVMKHYIFLLLAVCTITVSAQTNTNFKDWVNSLIKDSSGIIYAGTYSNGNGIFSSTDGGNTWQHTKMRYGVTSMTLTKSGSIVTFAYGYSFGRYLFRLSKGGSALDSMVLNFTPTCFAASQDGSLYASTFGQGIFKSTDDGAHWSPFGAMSSMTASSSAITITKEGAVLISTSSGVFRSTDDGKSWKKGSFGYFHDSLAVKQIIPSSSGKIYAGAFESMGVNANEIYVSADTGKNWTLISKVKFNLDALAIDSIGNIYAGNSDGVYRIKANGDTSYIGPGGVAVNGWGVRTILALRKDTIFASAWGGVYKTTNAGTSWEFLNNGMVSDTSTQNFTNPLPFGYYISSGVVDKDGNFIVGTDSAGVFRSIDHGKTWLQTSLTVPLITSVTFDSHGNPWAASLNNGVFKSTDNGASWMTTDNSGSMTRDRKFYTLTAFIANVPSGGSDSTHMIAEPIVFGGNDWGVYRYFEDLDIWSPTGTINTTVSAITSLSTDIVASTLNGDVYIYPGGWTEWKYKGRIGVRVAAIVGNSTGMLFAVGPNGVFRSIDKGASWIQKNFGILDTNLVSAAVDKAGNIFVGSYQSGDIYKSTDKGDSWTRFATLAYPVRCLFIDIAGGNIYAAAAGRFFQSAAVPTSVFQTLNVPPKDFLLEQNYPNPFNPTTTITFSVGTYNYTSLRVYDVLGREVAIIFSGELPAGSYTKQWNANGLPSGIYFYRLSSGSFTETKKLVLLK